ncbi:hypothetical protein [Aestuariispira insulae]|nr:hypothetical protein [Aestuariispira insulae]
MDTDALKEYSARHWLAWNQKERIWHRRILRPEAGTVILMTVEPGENLFFAFRSDEMEIIRDQEDLIFSFSDGALLVLSGFLNRTRQEPPAGFRFKGAEPFQTAPMA